MSISIGSPTHELEGEYWTQRKTTGTVTLTFRSKDLLEEVPADLGRHPMETAGIQWRRRRSVDLREEARVGCAFTVSITVARGSWWQSTLSLRAFGTSLLISGTCAPVLNGTYCGTYCLRASKFPIIGKLFLRISNHWKNRPDIFQRLENSAEKLGTRFAWIPNEGLSICRVRM